MPSPDLSKLSIDKTTAIVARGIDPNNVEAPKRFVFNETGNIMIATTSEKEDAMDKSVRDVFSEVSVFFAAMTKAISTTPDPDSRTGRFYSLYNSEALEAAIDGSGCFIHVSEEDVSFTSSSFGAEFSKELVAALLGLATGTGELAFTSALVQSVGKEAVNLSVDSSNSTAKVANIFFVIEYLLGMPIVSAIVVSADAKAASSVVKVGPCFSMQKTSQTLLFHKDIYLFVTPKFIEAYSGDLDKGMSDPAFLTLTSTFKSILTRTPTIMNVSTMARVPVDAPDTLELNQKYRILGNFFGSGVQDAAHKDNPHAQTQPPNARISLLTGAGGVARTRSGKELAASASSWRDDAIDFSIGLAQGKNWEPGDGPTDLFSIEVAVPQKKAGTGGDDTIYCVSVPRAYRVDDPSARSAPAPAKPQPAAVAAPG